MLLNGLILNLTTMAKNEKSIDAVGILRFVLAVVTAIVAYLETHQEDEGKEAK